MNERSFLFKAITNNKKKLSKQENELLSKNIRQRRRGRIKLIKRAGKKVTIFSVSLLSNNNDNKC